MGMSHAALTEHLTGWELPVISKFVYGDYRLGPIVTFIALRIAVT
jgi:hypothetical protein